MYNSSVPAIVSPPAPHPFCLSVGELELQEGNRGQKPALAESSQIAPEPVSSAIGKVFEQVSTLCKPAVEFQTADNSREVRVR